MTDPWMPPLRGQLDEHVIASEVLRGNPLGDPHERPLCVYTPPSYAGGPAIYVLQGFTGRLDMCRNRVAIRPSPPLTRRMPTARSGYPTTLRPPR